MNPENGRTYRGKITQQSPETITLRGCAGPFCSTQTWHSVRTLQRVLEDAE